MSFTLFVFLILSYTFPKLMYFIIIKYIFKIEFLKISYLLYVLILGFFPIYITACVNYFFGYSFENIKTQYFDSPITSVLNPIDLFSLFIVVYLLRKEVKFSVRDSILLFLGYIFVFIFLNLVAGVFV